MNRYYHEICERVIGALSVEKKTLGTREGNLQMAKFSILMACHNKAKYISACIQSIMDQLYSNWECIVVDDNSEDPSYSLLTQIKDPRFKVLKNKRRLYCSSTYALALQHATGEICGVVDGDDVLDKRAIGIMVKRYKNNPDIDWIYSQFHWCNKNLTNCRQGLSSMPKSGKSLVDMALAGRHCYSHWRTFKKSLAEKGTLFPDGLQVSVDKNLGFSLEELGNGGFLPKRLYYYRYYKGNMSLSQAEEQKQTTLRLASEFQEKRKAKKIGVFPIVKLK